MFSLPSLNLSMPTVNTFKRITNFLGNMRETIGNYIELIVLLVLAPTILSFWATFKDSISDTSLQNVVSALTVIVVLGIAVSAIAKVASD